MAGQLTVFVDKGMLIAFVEDNFMFFKVVKIPIVSVVILALVFQMFPLQKAEAWDPLGWLQEKLRNIKIPAIGIGDDGYFKIGNRKIGGCLNCLNPPCPPGKCASPFSDIRLKIGDTEVKSQRALVDEEGRLLIPELSFPDVCELRIPMPQDDLSLSEEQLIAQKRACSYFRRLQKSAADQIYLARKIFNNTDPFTECLFLRNCRSSCQLKLGKLTFTVTILDIANLFLPTGFVTVIQKIVNIGKIVKEVFSIYDAVKSFLSDGIQFVNKIIETVGQISGLFASFSELGLKFSDAFIYGVGAFGADYFGGQLKEIGVSNDGVIGWLEEQGGKALTAGDGLVGGVGTTVVLNADRAKKGFDSLKQLLLNFAENNLKFSTAKAEALNLAGHIETDLNTVKTQLKREKEVDFVFSGNCAPDNPARPGSACEKRERLDSILEELFEVIESIDGFLDQIIEAGTMNGKGVTEWHRGVYDLEDQTHRDTEEFFTSSLRTEGYYRFYLHPRNQALPSNDAENAQTKIDVSFKQTSYIKDNNLSATDFLCEFDLSRVWPMPDPIYSNWFNVFGKVYDRTEPLKRFLDPDYIKEVIDTALSGCGKRKHETEYDCAELGFGKDAWRGYWEALLLRVMIDDPNYVKLENGVPTLADRLWKLTMEERHILVMGACVNKIPALSYIKAIEKKRNMLYLGARKMVEDQIVLYVRNLDFTGLWEFAKNDVFDLRNQINILARAKDGLIFRAQSIENLNDKSLKKMKYINPFWEKMIWASDDIFVASDRVNRPAVGWCGRWSPRASDPFTKSVSWKFTSSYDSDLAFQNWEDRIDVIEKASEGFGILEEALEANLSPQEPLTVFYIVDATTTLSRLIEVVDEMEAGGGMMCPDGRSREQCIDECDDNGDCGDNESCDGLEECCFNTCDRDLSLFMNEKQRCERACEQFFRIVDVFEGTEWEDDWEETWEDCDDYCQDECETNDCSVSECDNACNEGRDTCEEVCEDYCIDICNIPGMDEKLKEDIIETAKLLMERLDDTAFSFRDLQETWNALVKTKGLESELARKYVEDIIETIEISENISEQVSTNDDFDENIYHLWDFLRELREDVDDEDVIKVMDEALALVEENVIVRIREKIGNEYTCVEAETGFLHKIACFEKDNGKTFRELIAYINLVSFMEQVIAAWPDVELNLRNIKPEFRMESPQLNANVVDDLEKKAVACALNSESADCKREVNVFSGQREDGFGGFVDSIIANPLSVIQNRFDNIKNILDYLNAGDTSLLGTAKIKVGDAFGGGDQRRAGYRTAIEAIRDEMRFLWWDLIWGRNQDLSQACGAIDLVIASRPEDIAEGCQEYETDLLNNERLEEACQKLSLLDLELIANPPLIDTEIAKQQVLRQDVLGQEDCPDWICQGEYVNPKCLPKADEPPPDAVDTNGNAVVWPPRNQEDNTPREGHEEATKICVSTQYRIKTLRETKTTLEEVRTYITTRGSSVNVSNMEELFIRCDELSYQEQISYECKAFKDLSDAFGCFGGSSEAGDIRDKLKAFCRVNNNNPPEEFKCRSCLFGAKFPGIDFTINSFSGESVEKQKQARKARAEATIMCATAFRDLRTPLTEVMKVFSILIGIRSYTGAKGGIGSLFSDARKLYEQAEEVIALIKEAPKRFGELWAEKDKGSAGFELEPVQCIEHPMISYSASGQKRTGPDGGQVCPDVSNFFNQLNARFSEVRQNLRQLDLLRRNVGGWETSDRALLRIKIADIYPIDDELNEVVGPLYEEAEGIRDQVQYLWALATAINFANENCTCGQSYCPNLGPIPLCISGLPLTVNPLTEPYCSLVWILRFPLASLAEKLANDLEAEE